MASDQNTGNLSGGDNESSTRPAYLDGEYVPMMPSTPAGVSVDDDLLQLIYYALTTGGGAETDPVATPLANAAQSTANNAVSAAAAAQSTADAKPSLVDEDDMVSDSATLVPSQQSVKAYVDAQAGGISDVVDDTTPQLGGDLDLNGNTITGMVIGTDIQAHSAVLDATTASFLVADETKLDGIATGADVSPVLKVADYTALSALTSNDQVVAVVTDSIVGGLFRWDSSDLSTEVTADSSQAFYVAPDSDATGASGCWVRAHLGSEYPARFWGMDPSATDNAATAEIAGDWVSAQGGGTIVFDVPGVYNWVTTMDLADKTSLRFEPGVSLTMTNVSPIGRVIRTVSGSTFNRIQGLVVDGLVDKISTAYLESHQDSTGTFEAIDCHFGSTGRVRTSAGPDAIRIGVATKTKIVDCSADRIGIGVYLRGSGVDAGPSNVIIDNFKHTDGCNSAQLVQIGYDAEDVTIQNCYMGPLDVTVQGGHCISGLGENVNNPTANKTGIRILNNLFEGVQNAWISGTPNGSFGDVIACRGFDGFKVAGNTIRNGGEIGITAVHGSKNGIIANNLIENIDGPGIQIGSTAADSIPENIRVIDNVIDTAGIDEGDALGFGSVCGMRVLSSYNTVVQGNVFKDVAGAAIHIWRDASADITDLIVQGNTYNNIGTINIGEPAIWDGSVTPSLTWVGSTETLSVPAGSPTGATWTGHADGVPSTDAGAEGNTGFNHRFEPIIFNLGGQYLLNQDEVNGWGQIGPLDDTNNQDVANYEATTYGVAAGGLVFPFDVKLKRFFAWHRNTNAAAKRWGWVLAKLSKAADQTGDHTGVTYMLDETSDNADVPPRDYDATSVQTTDITAFTNDVLAAGDVLNLGVFSDELHTGTYYVAIQAGYLEFERVS